MFFISSYVLFLSSYYMTLHMNRIFKDHILSVSDTDSTDSDSKVGGLGKYSHGSISLVHQHWISQIKSAGSFHTHCTQAAEAHHKTSMGLTSSRVKHLRHNYTQNRMQKYLCDHTLFESLSYLHNKTSKKQLRIRKPGVYNPLTVMSATGPERLSMGDNLSSPENQKDFLHAEIRVSRVELMDMVCLKLGLPKTVTSYKLLSSVTWKFGQSLITPHGVQYWATDSAYSVGGDKSKQRRRDIFLLKGLNISSHHMIKFHPSSRLISSYHTFISSIQVFLVHPFIYFFHILTHDVTGTEEATVYFPDGSERDIMTAYATESTCFVSISYFDHILSSMEKTIPGHLKADMIDGGLTFVLGKWFTSHPSAWERDSLCRPMCPGFLRSTHCLWKLAVTKTPRKIMVSRQSPTHPSTTYLENKHLFGKSESQQLQTWNDEKNTYYGLVGISSIVSTLHMTREYQVNSMKHSDNWIESVTVV